MDDFIIQLNIIVKDFTDELSKAKSESSCDMKRIDYLHEKVARFMKNAKINRFCWDKYITIHPERFTRNLISSGDSYNLLLLVWGSGHSSDIHNHGGSQCFFRIMHGEILEERYDSKTCAGLIQKVVLKEGSVGSINDDIAVHKMVNMNESKVAISLHLYIPPYESVLIYQEPDMNNLQNDLVMSKECTCELDSKYGMILNDQVTHSSTIENKKINAL